MTESRAERRNDGGRKEGGMEDIWLFGNDYKYSLNPDSNKAQYHILPVIVSENTYSDT